MERLTKKNVSASGIYKTCCTQFRKDECNILQGDCSRCSFNEKVWNTLSEYENTGLRPDQIIYYMELLNGFRKYVVEPCEVSSLLVDRKNLKKAQEDISSLMKHLDEKIKEINALKKEKIPNDLFTKIAEVPKSCKQCKHSKSYGMVGDRYCRILGEYFTGNIKPPYKECPDECPIISYNTVVEHAINL